MAERIVTELKDKAPAYADVDPAVEDHVVVHGVHPPAERRRDRAGHRPAELARRGLGRDLHARDARGPAGLLAAALFLGLLLADQAFERRFLGVAELAELGDLALDVLALRVGRDQQLFALGGQAVERAALLLGLRLFPLQLRLHAEQAGLDLQNARLVRPARADRAFVRLDEEAHVVPALREVAERARAQQNVDVAEVAVLVGVDEPPRERVLVPLERRLRGRELDAVPVQLALRGFDAALDRAEPAVDVADLAVGVRELRRDRTDPCSRSRPVP